MRKYYYIRLGKYPKVLTPNTLSSVVVQNCAVDFWQFGPYFPAVSHGVLDNSAPGAPC
jgi:hypothetical protein